MGKHKLLNKFIPTYVYHTIFDIDYQDLYDKGKRYILIDLDNTMIPYDKSYADDELKNLITKVKNIGFKFFIISNNHKKRVKLFSDDVNCPYINSSKKPFKSGFKKAIKMLDNPKKEEIITIGDQTMTDIFGSNRVKLDSVLVHPIKKKSEHWYTKVNRGMERNVLKSMSKHYPEKYELIKERHEY